ncbi:MAG: DUF2953 domain-containing protein [Candidatus Methanoperedens sp.]|nr:DUF2953 domain-containing protein [Candidatus Methanoperedens sp.]
MSIVAVVLVIIAALVLAALLSPVAIYIHSVRAGGKTDGSLSIRWVIFLFRYLLRDRLIEILILGKCIARIPRKKPERKKPEKPEGKKPEKIKRPMPPIGEILNLGRPALRLLRDLIHAFRLKYLDIDVTFGLDEPACTGMLTGLMHSVRGSSAVRDNIRFTPDFTQSVLNWNVKAEISTVPIKMVVPLARFVTSSQTIRSMLRIIRG